MTHAAYVIYIHGAGRCLQRRIIWQSDKPADRQINSLPRRHRDLIVSLTETLVSHCHPNSHGAIFKQTVRKRPNIEQHFLFISSPLPFFYYFCNFFFFGLDHKSQTNRTAEERENGLTHQREWERWRRALHSRWTRAKKANQCSAYKLMDHPDLSTRK